MKEQEAAVAARPAAVLIAVFALAKLGFHLANSSGYGYFRDECSAC